MTLKRVWIGSPNYSTRSGSVRLIVLHTSEGAQTYESLGSFFASSSSQVSSHVGIDDTPGTVGEYVKRDKKAWTASNANSVAVQAELCTPNGAAMGWTSDDWAQHSQMLSNAALWVAEEAAAFGIPLVKLSPAEAQGGGTGVCQHADLGSWGGGHTDCGPAFPIDYVLDLAQHGGATPQPTNGTSSGGEDVFIKEKNGDVYWLIYDGAKSYWRAVPSSLRADVPEDWAIDDSNGAWLALWQKGSGS